MPQLIRSTRSTKWNTLDAIVIALVCLVVATALLGPPLAPESVFRSNVLEALQPPSAAHWFGTDDQGRDVLWRLVAGARETLLAAMLVVVSYSAIGCLVAVLATVGGRWLDEVLMRVTDIALALPGMVVALGFAAAMGPSLKSAIIAMVLAGWPMTARLLRGVMHETMAMPFVAGARVLGVSRTRLMLRHVLPNSLDALLVKWAGDIGFTVLLLAGLSFIGVGAQPPSAEWGAMISGAKGYIATAWWVALAPGLAIAVTAASFGLLGDLLQVRRNPALRKK
ncbi:ABC transporter permease [Saccharopolyspora sp. NPDC050642]|uniref:ABC transporter permease n=1 Tax=Saccharopolyspora sp. NPDC050642 TaxID=3157099 RepID=UPI0033D548C4